MNAENAQIMSVPSNDGEAASHQLLPIVSAPAALDALTESQQRLRLFELCIEVLICQTKIGKLWVEGYEEASNLLHTLPLPTNEFNRMRVHLANALTYGQQCEFGAAAFELRALRGRVHSL